MIVLKRRRKRLFAVPAVNGKALAVEHRDVALEERADVVVAQVEGGARAERLLRVRTEIDEFEHIAQVVDGQHVAAEGKAVNDDERGKQDTEIPQDRGAHRQRTVIPRDGRRLFFRFALLFFVEDGKDAHFGSLSEIICGGRIKYAV